MWWALLLGLLIGYYINSIAGILAFLLIYSWFYHEKIINELEKVTIDLQRKLNVYENKK